MAWRQEIRSPVPPAELTCGLSTAVAARCWDHARCRPAPIRAPSSPAPPIHAPRPIPSAAKKSRAARRLPRGHLVLEHGGLGGARADRRRLLLVGPLGRCLEAGHGALLGDGVGVDGGAGHGGAGRAAVVGVAVAVGAAARPALRAEARSPVVRRKKNHGEARVREIGSRLRTLSSTSTHGVSPQSVHVYRPEQSTAVQPPHVAGRARLSLRVRKKSAARVQWQPRTAARGVGRGDEGEEESLVEHDYICATQIRRAVGHRRRRGLRTCNHLSARRTATEWCFAGRFFCSSERSVRGGELEAVVCACSCQAALAGIRRSREVMCRQTLLFSFGIGGAPNSAFVKRHVT